MGCRPVSATFSLDFLIVIFHFSPPLSAGLLFCRERYSFFWSGRFLSFLLIFDLQLVYQAGLVDTTFTLFCLDCSALRFYLYYTPLRASIQGIENTPSQPIPSITMPSIRSIISATVVGFVTFGAALPAQPHLSDSAVRHFDLATRQNAAAAAAGLTDIDILQL